MSRINKEFYEDLNGKKLIDQEMFEENKNLVSFFDLFLKIVYSSRLMEKAKIETMALISIFAGAGFFSLPADEA